MTEAKLKAIEERSYACVGGGVDWPLVASTMGKLVKAVRDAWAETARVTKELGDAEGREALLLAGSHVDPHGSRTTTRPPPTPELQHGK